MRIVFATTQDVKGSTVVGRVLPLAERWVKNDEVDVMILGEVSNDSSMPRFKYHRVGDQPFIRTKRGKIRLSGIELFVNMMAVAIRTTIMLFKLKPDVLVIVKPLPANVLGAALYIIFTTRKRKVKVVLDSDDFELTANKLKSWLQRAAIHWSERVGSRLADVIVVASPFLQDHFKMLVVGRKRVIMVATGVNYEGGFHQAVGGKVICYLGSASIASGHRVDLLVEILQLVRIEVSDATMLVVGGGDDITELRHAFRLAGLVGEVEFRGRFLANELSEIVRGTDVLVDPIDASISQRAKSSFRVALAGTVGMPVVSSNVGIRPYWLPDELHNKFFAEPADVHDYANKIIALIREPLTHREKEMMRKRAARYNWDRLAGDYYSYLC